MGPTLGKLAPTAVVLALAAYCCSSALDGSARSRAGFTLVEAVVVSGLPAHPGASSSGTGPSS
jgi:hypothetical protein